MLPASDHPLFLKGFIPSTIFDFQAAIFYRIGRLMQETWKFAEILFSTECLIERCPAN
jgi:hypothetical protein